MFPKKAFPSTLNFLQVGNTVVNVFTSFSTSSTISTTFFGLVLISLIKSSIPFTTSGASVAH